MERAKWYLVLLLVGTLLFVGGCTFVEEILESKEPPESIEPLDDVEYEIIRFDRLWQLVDAGPRVLLDDKIELVILCQPTERTWEKAYILEVIGEDMILNTLDPSLHFNWKWFKPLISETVTVRIEGSIVEGMLLDAKQRYENAKLEAEEIVEKQSYNFFLKGEVPSYEEYKRQEKKLEELNNEMKKWDAYSNGDPYGDENYNLHDFCSEYITIAITRIVIEQQVD